MAGQTIEDQLRELGISTMPALNTDTPFPNMAGQPLFITGFRFLYKGPARTLALGVAIKKAQGPLDLLQPRPFNNGGGLVDPFHTFVGFEVQATAVWAEVDATTKAGFAIPTPGQYYNRDGEQVEFGEGAADMWLWLVDITALQAAGKPLTLANMTREQFFVKRPDGDAVLEVDQDIVKLGPAVPAVSAQDVEVRYSP